MVYILALDPGGTTGWRSFVQETNTFHGGYLGPDPHHLELQGFLNSVWPDLVICESFQHTQMKSTILISVEYIGIIKLWCKSGGIPLKMQTAAEGKGFWDDLKLKKTDTYVVNKHIRDATRHLLHYMSFTLNDHTWIEKLRQ